MEKRKDRSQMTPEQLKEHKRAISRRCYHKNAQKINRKQNERRKNNPEREREKKQKYKGEWKEFIDSYKTPCVICGEPDPIVIDFHHIDPATKSFNISGHTRAKEKVINEIKKCVCLCANCHRRLHAGAVELPAQLPERS